MNTKATKLQALMHANGLTDEKVATITKRSVATVRIWRCKNPARNIPDHLLQLLELKVDKQPIPPHLAARVKEVNRALGAA